MVSEATLVTSMRLPYGILRTPAAGGSTRPEALTGSGRSPAVGSSSTVGTLPVIVMSSEAGSPSARVASVELY